MVRIGLSLYLIVTMLAGPALCCCALKPVAARAEPAQVQPVRKSCCQRHGSNQQQSKSTPGQRQQPDRPCPCKESNSSFLLPNAVQDAQQLLARNAVQDS